jgi:hypothetical protein
MKQLARDAQGGCYASSEELRVRVVLESVSEKWRLEETRGEACGRLGSPAEPYDILDKIVAAPDQGAPAAVRGCAPAVCHGRG